MKKVKVSRRQILKGLVYSGVAALAGVPLPAFARGITRQIEGTDLLNVCLNDKYGFINHSGSIVIKPRFEATWGFTEGLAWVKWDGKFGFIDQGEEFVISPRFSYAGEFRDGRAAVEVHRQERGHQDQPGLRLGRRFFGRVGIRNFNHRKGIMLWIC